MSKSWARDLNAGGVVVGGSAKGAFMYTESIGVVYLNDLLPANSGWSLGIATGINDKGDIVGEGRLNGLTRKFLLTEEFAWP
jgi:hypothetical protein